MQKQLVETRGWQSLTWMVCHIITLIFIIYKCQHLNLISHVKLLLLLLWLILIINMWHFKQNFAIYVTFNIISPCLFFKFIFITAVNNCEPTNPCQNNGQCFPQGTNYVCICVPGFTGTHCETSKFNLIWACYHLCNASVLSMG